MSKSTIRRKRPAKASKQSRARLWFALSLLGIAVIALLSGAMRLTPPSAAQVAPQASKQSRAPSVSVYQGATRCVMQSSDWVVCDNGYAGRPAQ